MLENEKLTHELFFDDNYIKKFQSVVMADNMKVGLDIPIEVECYFGFN